MFHEYKNIRKIYTATAVMSNFYPGDDYVFQKIAVNFGRVCYFRVKCHRQLISVTDCRRLTVECCQNFHTPVDPGYFRSPDKRHRNIRNSGKFTVGVKTAQLSAVSIAPYCNRQCGKVSYGTFVKFFRQQNGSGAGRHYRQTAGDASFQNVEHIQFPEKFPLNGTFSSGQDQGIAGLR